MEAGVDELKPITRGGNERRLEDDGASVTDAEDDRLVVKREPGVTLGR